MMCHRFGIFSWVVVPGFHVLIHFYPFLASKIYPNYLMLNLVFLDVPSISSHPTKFSPILGGTLSRSRAALPVLGGLQVQDPGGRPGHCAQDHEDPNLETDAEEGVGLPDQIGIWGIHCSRATVPRRLGHGWVLG